MGNRGLNFSNFTWPMNMSSRHNNSDQNGEKDEKEMKKQLLDLDLYEPGMSVKDMRERIDFIAESKNEASLSSTNNSASPSDAIEAVQSPTTSPVDNHTMTNLLAKTTSRESTSPEAKIELYSKQWPSHKDNDSQDELIFNSRSTDNTIADVVRARKVMDESSNSRYVLSPTRDVNIARRNHVSQDIKTYCNTHRISKSMDNFDVFDCKVLPNDVPLMPRCPPKPRQTIRVVDGMPVIADEISAQKLAYLTEMANLAHSWKAQLVCKEFSWGPPIKVGIANGSLDKFPIQEDPPDEAEPPEQSCLITREVNPSSYSLRPTIKSTNLYDFNDSDEDFETDKRKKPPKILSNRPETPRQLQQKKNLNRDVAEKTTKVISLLNIPHDKLEKTNSTLNGRKRAKSASPEYPEEIPLYPRRIAPPTPSNVQKSRKKTPVSTTRIKKRTASPAHKTEEQKLKKSTSGLSDKEIADLISDDEEPKIVDCAVPPTKRLNKGVEYLKKAQQAKEDEKRKLEYEAKLVAEKEAREKEERVQRRISERDERRQQQEEREKSAKEREDRYRCLTSSRSQAHVSGTFQKRTELESEELRPRTLQLPPESMDVDDTDMFPEDEYENIKAVEATEQPKCPICGKCFSQDEIENHAANCDDFVQDEPKDATHVNRIRSSTSRGLPKTFTCEICEFATPDEGLHKQHFSQCVRSLTEEGSRSTELASTSTSSKIMLSTHDSDVEIDQIESISSPSVHGKRKPKLQSRKKKF